MAPKVPCPTCRREIDWANSPYRPFCSERCKMIDLGAWLSGQRSIPGDDAKPLDQETGHTPQDELP